MRTKLLLLTMLVALYANAQTTHDLNWERFANGPEMDITIDVGDTVRWTWTDAFPHTVENVVGSAVETFNSGTLTGVGETYSYTFTVEGDNDYFCGIHGAGSMSGTITVQNGLSTDEFNVKSFSLIPNPVSENLDITLAKNFTTGSLKVYNLLGKQVLTKSINSNKTVPLNVSNWKKGFYILRVSSENTSITKRFIVK